MLASVYFVLLWFQDSSCTSRETLYCEIFVMAQCSVSMTLAHVIEYGERKWVDICENQFSQLSAGNLIDSNPLLLEYDNF